jgi:hypothetical protein
MAARPGFFWRAITITREAAVGATIEGWCYLLHLMEAFSKR